MKKIITTFLLLYCKVVMSQEFSPGYYIVNSSAEYMVIFGSMWDAQAADSGNDLVATNDGQGLLSNIFVGPGEILFSYEFSKGIYYCFSPSGRILAIKGANALSKANVKDGANIGILTESIQLLDGGALREGSFFLLTAQDVSKSTVTIQYADNRQLEIPQSKISFYSLFLKELMKLQTFKTVE